MTPSLYRTLLVLVTGCAGACTNQKSGAGSGTGEKAAVLFLVDGLMSDALATAAASGGRNLKLILDGGVRVEKVHTTSPAAVIELPTGAPGGTAPWANASSGNVAVHTGCHLFESNQMDDIFLLARRAGIRSVFSGGLENYSVFTSPDFHYGLFMDDPTTVQHAIDHLKNDRARLLRVHLQRIRDFWTGPADRTSPQSSYIRHLVEVVDGLLGDLIQALKDVGVWENTYLVLASDHGMHDLPTSAHPPASLSSWNPVLAFHGPGLKKGTTIPYAELPDVAVTTAHLLGLPPLQGHLDPRVDLPRKGTTGTVLTNLLQGQPADLPHPRYIERCLQMGIACTSEADDFLPYRQVMLELIK